MLVGVVSWPRKLEEVEDSLDELSLLIDTAGADEAARIIQTRESLDPATLIGKGKVDELHEICLAVDADTVVFDEELTPAQQRNLEKILGRTAIDRTAVILDIFAQNARSEEGRAQVELALLRYRLPRLRGRGGGLSQQAGGIGTRGPGETQLEVDRRRIMRRITRLEQDLRDLQSTRKTQRKSRRRGALRTVSLVGYTNSGKSTLLNAMTSSDVLVENRLFATLDPRTRRAELPGGESILISDTVGFIRKLPHQLVEAFQSTLEVVADSDLLVHVVDSSNVDPEGQMEAVRSVLGEIDADGVPELLVFNKADLARETADLYANARPRAVAASALTGEGLGQVFAAIAEQLRITDRTIELDIPYDRGDVIAGVHRAGAVIDVVDVGDHLTLTARLDEPGRRRFAEFARHLMPTELESDDPEDE